MKYLLGVMLLSYIITFLVYRASDRPGDDFGIGIIAALLVVVSLVLSVWYIVLIFWNHRFL